MLDRVLARRTLLSGQDLTFLAGVPYVYHCHHFNLFHDQTIDDALGDERGAEVRTRAARNAFRELLRGAFDAAGASTAAERVQLGQQIFAAMGHGTLKLRADARGGDAVGTFLHYGHTWIEKYGSRVRRSTPADAVAAGFASALAETALGLDPGSVAATERQCVGLRDPDCRFDLARVSPAAPPPAVDEAAAGKHVGASFASLDEERIAAIAKGLRDFVGGVAGDERGLVQAFNVFVTMHLSAYYNETAYEVIHTVERTEALNAPVAEALLREAGQVCAFNTFGNILLSPEWEGMIGPLSGKIEDTIPFCMAIARALGFGHWAIHELVPGKRFVMRTSSSYEAPFYLTRYGRSDRPRGYFLQGAAMAINLLAHQVAWRDRPKLTNDYYAELFRGRIPWRFEQTRCQTRGDAENEVVVEAL